MYNNNLYHSGVMGMHWGQRRYQNEDGSYKPGAEGRYYTPSNRDVKKLKKIVDKYGDFSNRNYEKITNKVEKASYKLLKDKDVRKAISLNKKQDAALDHLVEISNKVIDKYGYEYDDDPQYKKAYKEYETAHDNYMDECKQISEQLLGKYGKEPLVGSKITYSQYAKDGVGRAINKIGKQKV